MARSKNLAEINGSYECYVPMVHQFTVKERSVTNFCYKYSVTENGKWNHAQENEETILKTAEYLSVNAAVKHLDSCTWLSHVCYRY